MIVSCEGGFFMSNFKNFFLLSLVIIIYLVLAGNLKLSAQTIDGLITEVDTINKTIVINDITYKLAAGTEITRNSQQSGLDSCRPLGPGFFQWARAQIIDENVIKRLEVYYNVWEGKIKKLSLDQKYIELATYNSDGRFDEGIKVFYFNNLIRDYYVLQDFNVGDYIVIIAGDGYIIKIVKDNI